jgi:hypothetical protein
MKTFAFIVLCFSAGCAQASTINQAVRVFYQQDRRQVVGDVIESPRLLMILYLDEPCRLPVDGAKNMRAYWQNTAFGTGCWYPTLGGEYVAILNNGYVMAPRSGLLWELAPRAVLHPDGTATITETGYDSHTYAANLAARRMQDMIRRVNSRERP